jgi:PIH1 N-terminal domain
LSGLCIKFHQKVSNDKVFVNICQTDGIPQPEDINENQLIEVLREGCPSAFKVPMSINEPRQSQDKQGVAVRVCDVAIHPAFFAKVKTLDLFRNFMITLVIEALESKYNIKLRDDNFVVLKNRQCYDKLVPHRVQNRDVKAVHDSYSEQMKSKTPGLEMATAGDEGGSKKKLIEEVDATEYKKMVKSAVKPIEVQSGAYIPNPTKLAISQANTKKPEYRLFQESAEGAPEKLIAEFLLPECVSRGKSPV